MLGRLEDRLATTGKNIADSQLSKMKEDILTNDNYAFKGKVVKTNLNLISSSLASSGMRTTL